VGESLAFLGVFFFGFLVGFLWRGGRKEETPKGLELSERALKNLKSRR